MVKILNAANDALFKHDRTNCEEFLSLIKVCGKFILGFNLESVL